MARNTVVKLKDSNVGASSQSVRTKRSDKNLTAVAEAELTEKALEIEGLIARSEGAHLLFCFELGAEFQKIKDKYKKKGLLFIRAKLQRGKTWVYSYIKINARFTRSQLESISSRSKGRVERAHLVHLASKRGMTNEAAAAWLDRIADSGISPKQLKSELYPKKTISRDDGNVVIGSTTNDSTLSNAVVSEPPVVSFGEVGHGSSNPKGNVRQLIELSRVFADVKEVQLSLLNRLVSPLELEPVTGFDSDLNTALTDVYGAIDALWLTLSAVRRRVESVRRRCSLQASSSSPATDLTEGLRGLAEGTIPTDLSMETPSPKLVVINGTAVQEFSHQ